MTLTVSQILNAAPVLRALSTQKLPAMAALHVHRLAQRLNQECIAASKARDALLTDENSILLSNGGRNVKPGFVVQFLAEPLFGEKVDVSPGVKPLTIEDLSAAQLSPAEIAALGPLFVDEEPAQ